MIEIISHGEKPSATCEWCGCKFKYTNDDVETLEVGRHEFEDVIKCPDCGNKVKVEKIRYKS